MPRANKKRERPTGESTPVVNGTFKKPLFLSVTQKDKIFFAKHLSIMIEAGIPIRDALKALLEQGRTPAMRYILSTCVKDLEGGQILAYSLNKFPRVFDPLFANVVSVGESSGTLAKSLTYLAVQLEKSQELKGKIHAALFYPIIVFVGAGGIGTYLSFFLLPKLIPLFGSLGTELPATTRALLTTTTAIRGYWQWFIVGAIILIVGLLLLVRLAPVRLAIHTITLRIPVIGKLNRMIQTTQAARILGTLLTAGVKVVTALNITGGSLKNLVYRNELQTIALLVERGETITQELVRRPHLFDATATSIIRVGETTGRLSESLLSLASFTESELDQEVENLSSFVGPVVLILVGFLVGFLALSIISPIYQITQSLHV